MAHPHVHTLVLDIEIHLLHGPRGLQAQQVLVQSRIAHGPPPFGEPSYRDLYPLKTRKNLKKRGGKGDRSAL